MFVVQHRVPSARLSWCGETIGSGHGIAVGWGMAGKRTVEPTEDGHYVVIDGRRWRATNPNLPEDERQRLVKELMAARRAVGAALKAHDAVAEKAARERVNAAKVALGERGPKWWEKEGVKNEKT